MTLKESRISKGLSQVECAKYLGMTTRNYQNYEYKEEVFKFKFTQGGEFDMGICNKINNTCKIYEIKHSNQINERQTRYLKDNQILKC